MSVIEQARAQGIEYESLSGESVAEQLRQTGVELPYNLKVGPVGLRVDGEFTASYNDNINLAKTGAIADFIITPSVSLHGIWKVSDLNTLAVNVGVGYQTYLSHPEDNSVLLSPDTEAQFNFFIGEVALKLHESLSYQQDPTQIGQLSNTTKLSRFTNDAGVGATWDLGEVVLQLDYDHTNFWVTSSVYNYLTNQSDTLAPKVTYKVDKSINAGLSMSLSDTRYEKSFENDNENVSVGPFVAATISDNLSVQAQAGGYFTYYDKGGGNGDNENIASYYGSLGINHRINDSIQESLTAGREFLPGLTSNFTERIFANYTATWQATHSVNVGANLIWENLNDSQATLRETSNRYGLGLNLNDSLTQNTVLSLNYQYLLKDANPAILGYEQNSGTVGLSYQF